MRARALFLMRISVIALPLVTAFACATGVDPVRDGVGGAPGTTSTGLVTSSTSTLVTTGDTTSSTTNTTSTTNGPTSTTSTTTGPTSTSSSTTATSSTGTTSSTVATTSTTSGPPVAGLHVQYDCAAPTTPNGEIKPHLKVVNGGTASVNLSELTMRYYFTADGASSFGFSCDYAQIGCGNITNNFAAGTGTKTDHYLEIGFGASAGMLGPGADTGEIQARFHEAGYAIMFDQTNDYSFDATKTAFADWDKVTLYQNGTLVWGTAP